MSKIDLGDQSPKVSETTPSSMLLVVEYENNSLIYFLPNFILINKRLYLKSFAKTLVEISENIKEVIEG